MSPNPYLLSRFTSNIPMPTLYAGDAVRKPKLSVIEVLLYNMAALLAGVAAGYDVRMSNVSPVHPTLLCDVPALKAPMDMEFPGVLDERSRFAANTYHGTGKHCRTALHAGTFSRMEENIVHPRDSPKLHMPAAYYHSKLSQPSSNMSAANTHFSLQQQKQQQLPLTASTTSGLGSNFTNNTSAMLSSSLGSHTQPPTPSPRRKISTSSFTENLEYSAPDETPPSRPFEGFRVGGGVAAPMQYARVDYLRNGPSFSNDGGAYGAGAHRTGYFGSNYFPYRPESSLTYQRDCKSYPDYSYDYNHRLPNYYDYNYEQPPAQVSQSSQAQHFQTRTPPPRVPQMGVSAAGHRRTPSTISNNSNINQSFAYEHDEPDCRYEYNNLNLNVNMNIGSNVPDYVPYREQPAIIPPPTKHELYKSSPKLANRLQRIASGANAAISSSLGADVSLNRLRDYENLPAYMSSPLHKAKLHAAQQQSPTQLSTPQHNVYTHTQSTPMSPNNMQPLLIQERPASLPFEQCTLGFNGTGSSGNKLRSSLKKYNNYKTPNGNGNGSNGTDAVGGSHMRSSSLSSSQQGTPTNPTPPDSLTSDDSSYLSAKEGSISSQHSRVRFSPESFLDANSGAGNNGSLSAGSGGSASQSHDYVNQSVIALFNRRLSRRHNSDISTSSPTS